MSNTDPSIESERRPLLSARQVGVAAAFGGAALALVLAGVTIPIPGTPVVTDPREIFTTTGASLTGPIGGIVIGILAGIAEPGIPLASLLAHIVGGIYNGFLYKNLSWRFRSNKIVYLGLMGSTGARVLLPGCYSSLRCRFDRFLSRSGIRWFLGPTWST
jgi:hypothetical protein